jgi:hypothetical protein
MTLSAQPNVSLKEELSVRTIAFLLVSLWCATAAAQTVPDATPEELLTYIYQQYVGKKGTDTFEFNWTSEPIVSRLFEPGLAKAIVAAGKSEEPVIDFDPFVNGQDFEITAFTLKAEQKTADRARISARVINFKKPTIVAYELVRVPAGWRIRDISWGRSQPNFRKVLKVR